MSVLGDLRYHIKTFGCQMNKHDSEVAAGLLDVLGLQPTAAVEEADLIVFLTCCVRENADERLRGQVASLKVLKTDSDGRTPPLIAVGGCIGQRDGEKLLEVLPHVDIVFGTHNIERLPALYQQALAKRDAAEHYVPWRPEATVEVQQESDSFAADLPTTREHPWHAWLPITQGCDNYCSYCIVPYVRGRERSRPFEDVVAQAHALVADGVLEITLLGQNVNSYGRDLYGTPRFADILRAVAATGIKRLGFATSHPKDLLPETIEVMATTANILTHLHLPVQSGSDRILAAMGRCYTRDDYLNLVAQLRAALPHITLSTDMIVGFPGESEADFAGSLALAREVCFDQMFTFLFSPREGTPAATMENTVPAELAQKRFDQLVECVQSSALICNERLVASRQEVLIEGASKRDEKMLTGRTMGAKIVHLPLPDAASAADYAGRIVPVTITAAHKWFLQGELLDQAACQ
ncbi:MAG: tRNA (N6-isopentenyl adenosine(37)-C2)-methylthiotransferase MiaB [Coriobacteriia bacterium]|nr:tRNA (N6-isopentenyl adenosine(37)-C2)-methylthiotransferase MiaB [Coriobacteriia bacterium]